MEQKVAEWSTSDVSKWLKDNGFQTYAELIAKKHQIDGKALLTLTENDLREPPIAIPVLGVIKRLAIKLRHLQAQNYEDFSALCTWNKHSINQPPNVILDHSDRADHERSRFRRTWVDRLDSECSVVEEDATPVYANGRKSPRSEELQPEFVKLAVSFVYMFAVALLSAFVMAVVHDRVPDMKKYPPLPDIFLDNMPYVPWAFQMCEVTGLLLLCIWCGVLFFHKHRFILMRRWFSLTGTVFLLRCFTMLITSLSVPGTHLQCEPKPYGDVYEKLYRAFIIWKGIGMSLQGVRTCGDYMFSGHTVVVTMFNFFITEYTPRRTPMLHTLSWVMNIFGIFFILAAHEHYSIDVFIAFYISSRLFLYYHSLANSQALLSPDRKRARVWFPLFSFFESRCNVIVPNEYEWPLPSPSSCVQYFKESLKKHS